MHSTEQDEGGCTYSTMVCRLVGMEAGWYAGWLVCRLVGMQVGWYASWLVCRKVSSISLNFNCPFAKQGTRLGILKQRVISRYFLRIECITVFIGCIGRF
jgi:hypothetical protein